MHEELINEGFLKTLGLRVESITPECTIMRMPVTAELLQSFGYLHGGATISLLETAASIGAVASCDPEIEIPFATEVTIRHRKSVREGCVYGEAVLDHSQPSQGRAGGVNQYWSVQAKDDAGDIVSEGTVVIRIVNKSVL